MILTQCAWGHNTFIISILLVASKNSFFFLFFLGPHLWAYGSSQARGQIRAVASCQPTPQSQQHQIWATAHPLRKAKDQNWTLMDTSQFLTCWAMMGTPRTPLILYLFIYFCLFFLGPHPQPLEVPRLGVQSEPHPQQCGIRATSATYTTAHGNARPLTHWWRPGIDPVSSWILVRFVSAEPWQELQELLLKVDILSSSYT